MISPITGSPVRGPGEAGGHWVWRASAPGVEVRFVGRRIDGAPVDRPRHEVLAAVDAERPVAWARQIHSARVLEATEGRCGEGDALVGGRDGTALSVITADCVPVLLAAGARLAAIHAGWRGLAGGVVQAAIDRLLPAAPDPSTWTAWIGPSIGACCYEVGDDVAARVAAASTDRAVITPGPGRPHLDLPVATIAQLARAGIGLVRPVLWCTRCETTRLHSYRREGEGAGRNVAFIWRTSFLPTVRDDPQRKEDRAGAPPPRGASPGARRTDPEGEADPGDARVDSPSTIQPRSQPR